MKRASKWLVVAAPVLAAVALAWSGGVLPGEAEAAVPTGTPVFSNPTEFDNPFFPFEEGGFRVFAGKEGATRIVFIDSFTGETRDFSWNGGTVTCVMLQETEFEDGELTEISKNWFARADDGSVYYFGETVDEYEDGAVASHDGSWLVGGPSGDDPEETDGVDDPALFMPANPEVGDQWMPEDVPDGPQELDECKRIDKRVKVTAGTFEGCIEVFETDVADGATETKWYAPGVGVIKGKAKGESFKLLATTLFAEEGEE